MDYRSCLNDETCQAERALDDQAVDVASEIGFIPGDSLRVLTTIVERLEARWVDRTSKGMKKSVTLLTVRVEKPDGHYLYLPTPASAVLLEVMREIEMRWRISIHQQSLRLELDFPLGQG